MKTTHKMKVTMARGMGGFRSKAWDKHRDQIADRVKRKEEVSRQ